MSKFELTRKYRNVCFTINNPQPQEIEILKMWPQVTYIVMGDEICPKTLTPHIQGYLELKTVVLGSTIKNKMPRAHIEQRFGTAQQASDYCKKEGRFLEAGVISLQGQRNDLIALADDILAGYNMRRVACERPDMFIKYNRGIMAFHALIQKPRAEKPKVIVFYGKSGSGKTRLAKSRMTDKESYTWSPAQGQWFDGYMGEKTVLFDEFRGQLPFGQILSLLDRYDTKVQYKGGMIEFQAIEIFMTSPSHPKDWYQTVGNDRIDQLLRRIDEIHCLDNVEVPLIQEPDLIYEDITNMEIPIDNIDFTLDINHLFD